MQFIINNLWFPDYGSCKKFLHVRIHKQPGDDGFHCVCTCSVKNARLRGGGCLREDRTGVPPLQGMKVVCMHKGIGWNTHTVHALMWGGGGGVIWGGGGLGVVGGGGGGGFFTKGGGNQKKKKKQKTTKGERMSLPPKKIFLLKRKGVKKKYFTRGGGGGGEGGI